jgi:peptidoglycan hydrolase-like protein with peptidoglycan-binding domain
MPARDLELGKTGSDVLALQKLLNANGFTIAASGAGAPGSETSYFGALTKAALAKYQQAHGIAPSAGYFGPLTRARMKGAGLAGVWW